MKTVTMMLIALCGCGADWDTEPAHGPYTDAGHAAVDVDLDAEALSAICQDSTLQKGSRDWLRKQYPAITSCSGAATDAQWFCSGQGGQTWTVVRTYNSPGLQVKRRVERSQGTTKKYSCAGTTSGACGYSCGWY